MWLLTGRYINLFGRSSFVSSSSESGKEPHHKQKDGTIKQWALVGVFAEIAELGAQLAQQLAFDVVVDQLGRGLGVGEVAVASRAPAAHSMGRGYLREGELDAPCNLRKISNAGRSEKPGGTLLAVRLQLHGVHDDRVDHLLHHQRQAHVERVNLDHAQVAHERQQARALEARIFLEIR